MSFDLKGSKYNRTESFKGNDKQWWLKKFGHRRVMKDMNLLQINSDLSNSLINFPEEDVINILSTISKDSKFLMSKNIMDYSLLFVIEQTNSNPHTSPTTRGL